MRRELAWFAVLLLACSEGERDGASSIFGSAGVTMSADGSDMSADGSSSAGESDATSTSTSTNGGSTGDASTDSTDTTSDTATDTSDTNAPVCGNGSIDPGEDCDGLNLGGSSCVDHGFDGGVLACDPVVCVYDTSGCTDMPSNECDSNCNGCACPSDECTICCSMKGQLDVCGGGSCGCFG